jgi:hypothetical protein
MRSGMEKGVVATPFSRELTEAAYFFFLAAFFFGAAFLAFFIAIALNPPSLTRGVIWRP